jgi:hypothetical protein
VAFGGAEMLVASKLDHRMRAGSMPLATLALAGVASGVAAQDYDPTCAGFGGAVFGTEQEAFCTGYNGGHCTGEYLDACEEGRLARSRRDATSGTPQNQAQPDEIENARQQAERLPMLAPQGNPLLGRWHRVATAAPPAQDLVESLMQLGNELACGFIAGEGPDFEFRADALIHGAQKMDAMRYYRGQNGVVLALGERYRPPLAFNFDGPNRTTSGSCTFERVGVVATAPAPASPRASAAPTTALNGGISVLDVQLGVDTVASVESKVAARGSSPVSSEGPGGYRLASMSGDYSDGGPAVKTVRYDFDASGPDGRLIAVSIVNRPVTSAGYDQLLAERKAAARQRVGELQRTSATESLATAPNGRLRLIEVRPYEIVEIYELPR